jgi:5-methyltetrahydrofolate--homocysteine methyltransferase
MRNAGGIRTPEISDEDTMEGLMDDLRSKILLLDGAWGTNLNERGLAFGEEMNFAHIHHPSIMIQLAKEYIQAGSDILATNSFQASSISLKRYNRGEDAYELTYKAVKIIKDIPEVKYVGGCIGPTTGEFKEWAMDPKRAYTEDEFYETYKEQMRALKDAGADLVICKTFLAFPELRAALRASKAYDMITAVSLAFNYHEEKDDFATIYGAKIDDLISLNDADIIGFNCGSVTLDQAVELTARFRKKTDKPLFAEPNGGIPGTREPVYTPDVFAAHVERIIEAGGTLVGGCCGTTPDHIRALRRIVDSHNA